MAKNVYLLGVSALAGEQIIELLDQSPLVSDIKLSLFDSEDEAGRSLMVSGSAHRVKAYESAEFVQADLVVFCAPQIPEEVVDAAVAATTVLDLHSRAQTLGSPLLVSGLTAQKLESGAGKIYLSPEPALLAAAQFLASIRDQAQPLRVTATLVLPASLHDQAGIQALASETAQLLNGREATSQLLEATLAFNTLAQPQGVDESGAMAIEQLFVAGLPELLADQDLEVAATALQAPLFHGTALTLAVELRNSVALEELIRLVDRNAKLRYTRSPGASTQSVTGADCCLVSRLRVDSHDAHLIQVTLMLDEQRLGRASNALELFSQLMPKH